MLDLKKKSYPPLGFSAVSPHLVGIHRPRRHQQQSSSINSHLFPCHPLLSRQPHPIPCLPLNSHHPKSKHASPFHHHNTVSQSHHRPNSPCIGSQPLAPCYANHRPLHHDVQSPIYTTLMALIPNDKGVTEQVHDLSLLEDEDEETSLVAVTPAPTAHAFKLCVAGTFLGDRPVNFLAMQRTLAIIWKPGRKVDIEDLNDGIYLFRFHHTLDLRRIMTDGPWNYDDRLLLLHELQTGKDPRTVPFHLIPFWVQVHNLPFDHFSEAAGRILGNFAGRYLDYDPKNSRKLWIDQYMRIQVELDVRRPLKCGKRVRLHGDESVMCKFRYERLQTFCYICGITGHSEKYCETHFHAPADQIVRKWDDSIRVKPRNPKQQLAARWLGEQTLSTGDRTGLPPYRNRPLFQIAPKPIPASLQALAIYGGASTLTANRPLAYTTHSPEDDEEMLEIGDDRKRRRAKMPHTDEERSTKSPTKPGVSSENHYMTE